MRAPWLLMLLAWPAGLGFIAAAVTVARADTAVGSLPGNRFAANPLPVANQVVVRKGERRLELWRGRELLRSYRISLGLNPNGVEVQRERKRPLHWRGCVGRVQGLHKVLHVGRGLPELF